MASCGEHDLYEEKCKRCAWVNEEIDRIAARLRGLIP
jgi:hypothetical protein